MSVLWLGQQSGLREDVSCIYEEYKDRISRGKLMMLSPPGGEEKFYVYEWFTKDTGKVFYVGKGTGSRYRHIIYDMKRPRGAEYKELREHFGIDSRFIAKGLTSREAEIYELCMIIRRTDQGEVLLQFGDNPGSQQYWADVENRQNACIQRNFAPEIVVDPYHRRYFDVVPPSYDPVDLSRLRVTFSASYSKDYSATRQEMEQVRALIDGAGGRVFATAAKSVQAIVEFDMMDYNRFMSYKAKGLLVYHAFDVVRHLASP